MSDPKSQLNVSAEALAERVERVLSQAVGRGYRATLQVTVDNGAVRVDHVTVPMKSKSRLEAKV